MCTFAERDGWTARAADCGSESCPSSGAWTPPGAFTGPGRLIRGQYDERVRAAAARLAGEGRTQAQVSAELGVPARTLRTWGIEWPAGRPRVSDEDASPRTGRRRRTGR